MNNNKDDSSILQSLSAGRDITLSIKSFLFDKIVSNEKVVEARIGTDKYSNAQVGDTLKFLCGTRKISRKIIAKATYNTFEDMLTNEGLKNCLPGVTNLTEGVQFYHDFNNYKSMELKYGVVAYKLSHDSASNNHLSDVNDCNNQVKPKRRYGELVRTKSSAKKCDEKRLIDVDHKKGDKSIVVQQAIGITKQFDVNVKEEGHKSKTAIGMAKRFVDVDKKADKSNVPSASPFDGLHGVVKKKNKSVIKSEPMIIKAERDCDAGIVNIDDSADEPTMVIKTETDCDAGIVMIEDSEDSVVLIDDSEDSEVILLDESEDGLMSEDSNSVTGAKGKKRTIQWISSGKSYKMPNDLWNSIYVDGCIPSDLWTYYKNKIGDDFDTTWPCILILTHKNVGKNVISMQGKCKHKGCRLYNFTYDRKNYVEGDSPAFKVRFTNHDLQHKNPLTRQLRGAIRDEHKEKLKHCKAASLSRQLILEMDEEQYAQGNANKVKSDDVILKVRNELLASHDLAKEDFSDMVALQDATKDDPYISKVLSPFGVYMHSKLQYKVLEQRHKRNRPGEEVVGFLDSTGDVVKVEPETSTHPILYYPLLIPIKGDPNDKNHMLFPVTDCLNSAHAAPNISGWLSDFNGEFIKACPTIHPTFHRIMSDFSYANFHGILHSFQSMRIQQYIYLCYKFSVGLIDFSPLQNITKVEMCKTHLSKTFAEFVRKYFPSPVANKKTCYEQKFVMEILCSMIMCRSYNVLKEIYRNLSIMLLSKNNTPAVISAKETIISLCTSDPVLDGDVKARYKFDKLLQSDMDKMSECTTIYDFKESILNLPIYKSSSFYYDFKHITDTVIIELQEEENQRDSSAKQIFNSFHNENILPNFLQQFGGITPLWTSLTIPKGNQRMSLADVTATEPVIDEPEIEVEIKRSSNQPAESHMNIVKQLLQENALELGSGKIKATRFVKLLRPLVQSHAKRYLLKVPRGRLNYGPKIQAPKDSSKVKKTIVRHLKKKATLQVLKMMKKTLSNSNDNLIDATSIQNAKESWGKRLLKRKPRKSYFDKKTLLSSNQVTIVNRNVSSSLSVNTPTVRKRKVRGKPSVVPQSSLVVPKASKARLDSSKPNRSSVSSTMETCNTSKESCASSTIMETSNASNKSTAMDTDASLLRVHTGEKEVSRKEIILESNQNNGLLCTTPWYYINSDPSWQFIVAKINSHKLSLGDYKTLTPGSNISLQTMNYIFEYMVPPTYINLTLYADQIISGVDELTFTITDNICYMPVLRNGSWHLYFINTKKRSFTYCNPCQQNPMNFSFFFDFIKVYNSSTRHKAKLRSDGWQKFDFESVNEPAKPIESGVYVVHTAYRFISQKTLHDIKFNPDEFRQLLIREVLQFSDDMRNVCLICGDENDSSASENIDWSMCNCCTRWLHDTCFGGKLGNKHCPPCLEYH